MANLHDTSPNEFETANRQGRQERQGFVCCDSNLQIAEHKRLAQKFATVTSFFAFLGVLGGLGG
jgi:hypothetical protein